MLLKFSWASVCSLPFSVSMPCLSLKDNRWFLAEQIRYSEGSATNMQRRPIQRAIGLRVTDSTDRGCKRVIQGSHAAAGRMDGDGFCVSGPRISCLANARAT